VLAAERGDLLAPGGLAGASVALQGFPVLERLLFVAPVAAGSYGAALAAAVGANLASIADELEAAWSPGSAFLDDLLMPGSSANAYADPGQVTGHLMTALATQLEFVAQRKIAGPLGESAEEARPRLAESWRSGRSLTNMRINLAAMAELFGGGGGRMAAAITDAGRADVAEAVGGTLAEAAAGLDGTGDDLGPLLADADGRERLAAVAAGLDDARRMLVAEGAPALGLSLGFNSLDGD